MAEYNLNGKNFSIDEGAESRYKAALEKVRRLAQLGYFCSYNQAYNQIIDEVDAALAPMPGAPMEDARS